MPSTIRDIVYHFSIQLKKFLGNELSKVILYGFYALGDFKTN